MEEIENIVKDKLKREAGNISRHDMGKGATKADGGRTSQNH